MGQQSLTQHAEDAAAIGRPRAVALVILALMLMMGVHTAPLGSARADSAGVAGKAGAGVAWGDNGSGRLGTNSSEGSLVPAAVDMTGELAGQSLTAVSAGDYHSCALGSSQHAYCWGEGGSGRLGDGKKVDALAPVAVSTAGVLGGVTLVAISAGNAHSCALDSAGKAYCWGKGTSGRLGNNMYTNADSPVAVFSTGVLADVKLTRISAGDDHTCGLSDAGKAFCWGGNGSGQLGNETINNSSVPVAVATTGALNGKTLVDISAGKASTCVLDNAGAAYCWGSNSKGQLGDGSTTNSPTAVPVAMGGDLTGAKWATIETGYDHTCAATIAGRAYCWGFGQSGQLGTGTSRDSRQPAAVSTQGVLKDKFVTAITSGGGLSCAIDSLGAGYCWGSGDSGRLGNGSTERSTVPVPVTADGTLTGRTLSAISSGTRHTVAVTPGGALPTPPDPPTRVTAVGGNRRATVTWQAGPDGGAPITDFIVRSSVGGRSCQTQQTSCIVTGLTNGTGYSFTVSAVSRAGESAPSDYSNVVTPRQVVTVNPVKILRIKSVSHKGRAQLSWRVTPQTASCRVRVSKNGGLTFGKTRSIKNRQLSLRARPGKTYVALLTPVGGGFIGPRRAITFTGKGAQTSVRVRRF